MNDVNEIFVVPKLHKCALIWFDKCAYCDFDYDGLKRVIQSSSDETKETLDLFNKKLEESLIRVNGIISNLHSKY
jgi:hypothetical protein